MTTPRKKIVISSYDDLANPYYGGGGALAIAEVATRLAGEYDITLVTGNYRGAVDGTRNGVTHRHIGPSFLGPKASQLLFHFLLPWYVMRLSFDVWIESFTPPFSTSCLQLFTKRPVIGLVHMLSGKDMVRKYKLPFEAIERHGLATYRHFIALTDASRAKLQSVNAAAGITVIPNGVLAKTSRTQRLSHNQTILFIGRLELNQKGLDLLLQAYVGIADRTNAKLVIAGTGLPREQLKLHEEISRLGLQDRVSVVGRVTGDVKDMLLANASVVAIPSRHETFGIVALEAMAHGRPVVTFDIDDLHWIPQDCAVMAKPFDSADFGQKLLDVLSDRPGYARMSKAATAAVKAYTWDAVAAQYRKLLQGFVTR